MDPYLPGKANDHSFVSEGDVWTFFLSMFSRMDKITYRTKPYPYETQILSQLLFGTYSEVFVYSI